MKRHHKAKYQEQALDLIEMAVDSDTDECIVWPFPTGKRGYGTVAYLGYAVPAHRLTLMISTCSEPEGMLAAHGPCNNRACINPRHLSWKTPAGNYADMIRDGTLGINV